MHSPSERRPEDTSPGLQARSGPSTSVSFVCDADAAITYERPKSGDRRWSSEPDRVYEQLRDDLTAGLFAPGSALVEASLAERYATSRTPARAAIARLVTDRLVQARPHSVAVVRDISARELRQIYEIRQALEGFAAEAAVGMIERSALERLLARCDESAPSAIGDQGGDEQADMPLHFLIAASVGNGRLVEILCAESLPLLRTHALFWRLALPQVDTLINQRRAAALDEHRAIATALLAGSGAQARSLVVEHLRGAADHLIALMTSVDLNRSNLGAEHHRPGHAATALDHMLPGPSTSQGNLR